MNNDSNKRYFKINRILFVMFLILVILSIMLIGSFNKGLSSGDSSKSIETYSSISSLLKNSSLAKGLNLEIPEFLTKMIEGNDRLQIRIILNSMIEIGYSYKFVLKASSFVDNKADTLGLYEKSSIDNQYIINNNETEVKFFRYRADYIDYPSCTIVNWCTDSTSYGLLLGDIYSEEEISTLVLGNSLENLEATSLNEIKDANNPNETEIYEIDNIFTVELPKFESQTLTQNTLDGFTTFYINKTLCFVFVYNDYDIDTQTFDGQSELKINDSVRLYYRSDNPFEKDSLEFRDYENLISNLDNIKTSVKMK